jgi:threonine aldolase
MSSSAAETPVNLRSDNVAGVAPEILAAIEAANAGTAPSYGADAITAGLQDLFSELFETRCFVQPVATGTATNALALALIAPPYGAVYCSDVGHVHDSECGAGEFYTGGAKIVPLAAEHGRLHPDTLRAALRRAPASATAGGSSRRRSISPRRPSAARSTSWASSTR